MLSKCHLKSSDAIEPLFMPHNLPEGCHISACGHVMHADCWRRFLHFMCIFAHATRSIAWLLLSKDGWMSVRHTPVYCV